MTILKDDVIEVMKKHYESNQYTNPYFIEELINAIENVYGEDNGIPDELYEWGKDMFER